MSYPPNLLKLDPAFRVLLPEGATGATGELDYQGPYRVAALLAGGTSDVKAIIPDAIGAPRLAKIVGLDDSPNVFLLGARPGDPVPPYLTLRLYPEFPPSAGAINRGEPIILSGRPHEHPAGSGLWDLEDLGGDARPTIASRAQLESVSQVLSDYGLILPNLASATAQLQGVLAELADLQTDIEQSQAASQQQITTAAGQVAAAQAQTTAANNQVGVALAQTDQAIQQAAAVSLMRGTVQNEAGLDGQVAGTYFVADTLQFSSWDGAVVTSRGPDVPTTQTAVVHLPSVTALRTYAGTARTIVVDDPIRGGTFRRRLSGITVDQGRIVAHSNPAYLYERVALQDINYVDWYLDPDFAVSPQIQAAINATPVNGTLVGPRKTVNGFGSSFALAPWARPDGRTDVCLTIDKPITLDWNSNEFAGMLTTDNLPATMRPLEISAAGVPYGGAKKGYRINGLGIMPIQFGKRCAKGALYLVALNGQNMADIEIRGGQYVSYNRLDDINAEAAIHVFNTGSDGIFGMRLKGIIAHGGFQATKWGDSCSITDYCQFTGHGIAMKISMLTPADPSNASSCLTIRDININTHGTAAEITGSTLFNFDNWNIESRNIGEGQTMQATFVVDLIDCGTAEGTVGLSARAWSGSVIRGLKVLPANGATYEGNSNQGGLRFKNCRAIMLLGGTYGGTAYLGADSTPAGRLPALMLEGSQDIVLDHPDLNLGPNSDGIFIDADCKNVSVRGYTLNPGGNPGVRALVDNGQGTMGVKKELDTPGWTMGNDVGGLSYIKGEDGMVRVFGSLKPGAANVDLGGFLSVGTLPAGFQPAPYDRIRRWGMVTHGQFYPGQEARLKAEIMPMNVEPLLSDIPGIIRANTLASGADDTIPAVTRLDVDFSFYAPRMA